MGKARVILSFLPGPLEVAARRVSNFVSYESRVRLLRQDPFIPPPGLHPVGAGDFRTVGEEFFSYFKTLAGLKPRDRVLDIGCGTGRMALPLIQYLDGGTYDGFDVAKLAIEWCRRVYSRRYAHFNFHHADLYNGFYNPRGKKRAKQFKLPFQEHTFDFVILASVFTHMLPADMEHYLAEVTRVMKPDGRCLATFFLITAESLQLMKSGVSALEFTSASARHYVAYASNAESAVAYSEPGVRESYLRHSLRIAEPIRYGSWCGREDGLSFQDIVVATK